MILNRVDIRLARPSDFEALLAMKADPEAVKWSGFPCPPEPNHYRRWFERALSNPDQIMFTGHTDGVICGYVHLSRVGPNAFNSSNGVATDFRGRSIGSLLLRNAFDALRKLFPGVDIETWVADGNHASQLMMRILGYRPTEITRQQQFFCPDRSDMMRRWEEKPHARA